MQLVNNILIYMEIFPLSNEAISCYCLLNMI